jgi:hypothetical protein
MVHCAKEFVMRNWKEEFQEIDALNRQVKDVVYHNGKAWGYVMWSLATRDMDIARADLLIPKPKLKKYRPWRHDEVPVGSVIRHKETKNKIVIVAVNPWHVWLGPETQAFEHVFIRYEMLDGSPCGVLEE